ncbi:tRNA-binding protein [Scopulibacillus darangshiensis]|uniref:tRNA-binding protein n=1 Tax=Scopulibacillus darangshiensis TaxID=442528 RepID=A0A4R2PDP5_9BACL|nr:DUF4479 family protein [Scopulibacillus darangshiensis]TCP32035.1 tRNA-binding protein [Scopulibacillus darangshiensis]
MNVYYNLEGVGDTLLIQLRDSGFAESEIEKKGNITRIYDSATSETTGYNLSEGSKYFSLGANGKVDVDQAFVKTLNELLESAGFNGDLFYDDRPLFIVGYVTEKEKHPNADKLNICRVDIGDETLQIVCGAPNVDKGQKVVVARVGARMPGGMLIKEAELRGTASYGMICSAKELALPDAPQEKGILVLDEKTPIGEDFSASMS